MSATQRGIDESLAHANSNSDGWSQQAYDALCEFAARGQSFTSPDVRRFARGRIPDPPTNMAWGGVFLRAKTDGVIVHAGFSDYSDDTMHSQTVRRWIAP